MKKAHFVTALASVHDLMLLESSSLRFLAAPPTIPCLSILERKGGDKVINWPETGFKSGKSSIDLLSVEGPLRWRMQSKGAWILIFATAPSPSL